MNTDQLAKYAANFESLLQNIDQSVSIKYVAAKDVFLSVYDKPAERYPDGGGV